MRRLTATDLLQMWELGQQQHWLDRALTLLAIAHPDQTWEELASLPIGRRDRLLLNLREQLFGTRLNAFALCPHCQTPLEFALDVASVRLLDQPVQTMYRAAIAGVEVKFRLPDSRDLGAVAACSDTAIASATLLRRCLLEVQQDGIAIEALPPELAEDVMQAIGDRDPQAEILLSLDCPACQHQWQMLFDIVSFFWSELSVRAKRLLQEVHTLALAYGWREADILALSDQRRQWYLEMVQS